MSTEELQELVADLARSTKELRGSQAETDRQMRETDRQIKESQKKTDRQLKELGKQIGGLGSKFGSFAEGLSYASIKRILEQDFRMNEFVAPGVQFKRDGREEEYDILAYSNGDIDKGMIVEVKSKQRQEDVDQMRRKMSEVFHWLPEHTNKTFYGMVVYVSGDSGLKRQIIKNGWYLAHVGEDLFEMETPAGFQPRAYTCG